MCLSKYVQDKKDLALLIVRIVTGVIFIFHGYQKLQMGFEGVSRFLMSLSFPSSQLFAYVLTLTELLGGIFLVLGFLSRLWALLLSFVMIVAIATVKIKIGLIAPLNQPGVGMELDLALLAGLLSILLQGPGKYSVDLSLLKKEIF